MRRQISAGDELGEARIGSSQTGPDSDPPYHDRGGQVVRQPAEVIGVRGEHERACRAAMRTTCASTTSEAPALPRSVPTSSACCGENATISQPRRNRRSCACRAERLTWATTGAVVVGTAPTSRRMR
jgi:hypothetical protein